MKSIRIVIIVLLVVLTGRKLYSYRWPLDPGGKQHIITGTIR